MNQKIDYVFSFAHRKTGLFNGVHLTISDTAAVALNTPADHIAVAGHHDHLSRCVDAVRVIQDQQTVLDAHAVTAEARRKAFVPDVPGQEFREPPAPLFVAGPQHVVDYQPPQPSPDHEWHEPTKRWQLSEAAQALAATHAAAVARIAALRDSQHDLVRRVLLTGDADARVALQGIEEEVMRLAWSAG